MSTLTSPLPLYRLVQPGRSGRAGGAGAAKRMSGARPFIRSAAARASTIGLPAENSGRGLLLERLNRVVDYPARDMTITVEAGMTSPRWPKRWRPKDNGCRSMCRKPARATLGGVVATATSGPRRYGQGTIRDYVIGISAVDGRGPPFKGGGRVVKNVAGYDFCKLLTGSLGTLGVITQVTFKLKPLAEASALVACDVRRFANRRSAAGGTGHFAHHARCNRTAGRRSLATDPALAFGLPESPLRLVVGLEGSAGRSRLDASQLAREWPSNGVPQSGPCRRPKCLACGSG